MPDRPGVHRTDGDGWVDCGCGNRHWGRFGAAGLLLVNSSDEVLLQHRAEWSHFGGTWGVPGGARASSESAVEAALREAAEEAGVVPELVDVSHAWVHDHPDWSYTTVVGTPSGEFDAHASDPESLAIRWTPVDEVTDLPLLPAFGELWPQISRELGRCLVLVVDVANVMGSRPDGWWRDRPAAAARLRDEIATITSIPATDFELPASTWWPQIVMVAEGKARGLEPRDGIDVVSAEGSGDDAIVATVSDRLAKRPDDYVVAVTADRELRHRVSEVGGRVTGPGTLLRLINGAPRSGA